MDVTEIGSILGKMILPIFLGYLGFKHGKKFFKKLKEKNERKTK